MSASQTWTKITGEPFAYPLAESGVGQFSGYEKIFWTMESDCTTNAPADSDTVVSGSVAAGNNIGTTSSVTLLSVKPQVMKLCYNDGGGTYAYLSGISLTVTGMIVLRIILCVMSGVL